LWLDQIDCRKGKRCKRLISKHHNLGRIAHEPAVRGFKSCRARQSIQGPQRELGPFHYLAVTDWKSYA